MRAALPAALSLCLLGSACLPYVRVSDGGYQQNDYVMRDAVTRAGQRLLLREERRTGELVVAQPQELAGERMMVDPDSPQGDVLVVRPVQYSDERGDRHHDRDHRW